MSGSGTPAAEYGAEAGRGVWRVALDYALYPTEAATAAGACGAPTVAVGERLFWGQDRLNRVAESL
jgi:2-hydroxychromene-2-carboxylate isomerase